MAFAVSAHVVALNVIWGEQLVRVSNMEELATAQELVGERKKEETEPIIVKIAPGFYELEESFRINRSNVSIVGESEVMFLLAAGVNQLVVAVGTQKDGWIALTLLRILGYPELLLMGARTIRVPSLIGKSLGVHEAKFEACQFEENQGGVFMASVDEAQSSGTRVLNSTFVGNEGSGRGNIVTSGSAIVESSIRMYSA